MSENILKQAITEVIRHRIDSLMTISNNHLDWFDEIGKIPGVRIFQNRNEALGMDCQDYLFGPGEVDISEWQRCEPFKGAIAMYKDKAGNIIHFGKVTDKGLIISKWGVDGHVYEHPPLYVPHYYGSPEYYKIVD